MVILSKKGEGGIKTDPGGRGARPGSDRHEAVVIVAVLPLGQAAVILA